MKEVIIKFFSLGINNNYQASVIVYDGNNIVYNGITYNGYLKICLKKNHVYRIKATFMGDEIITNIYIGNNNCYSLRFKNSIICNRAENPVTFLLTDYNYDNLPIERGEIVLWRE